MFLIVPNFFELNKCSYLIDLYQKNINLVTKWRDTYPLLIASRDDGRQLINFSVLKELQKGFCGFFNNYIERMEIVKWPSDSFQDKHFDHSRTYTSLASITYLNDDFEGGQTCVEDERLCVNPKTGTTFFFDGQKYEHNVTHVKNGTRYTLAIWYTDNPTHRIV